MDEAIWNYDSNLGECRNLRADSFSLSGWIAIRTGHYSRSPVTLRQCHKHMALVPNQAG